MGKQLAVTVNAVHRVGSKMYLTVDGVHRKVKKAYLTNGGVHKLCYEEGTTIGTMTISYTGTMIDAGVVSMADGEYRLLTLTSSGTLTVDRNVSAEVWLCGGGAAGNDASSGGGVGGGGAFTGGGSVTLSGSMVATVGAAGGKAGGTSTFDTRTGYPATNSYAPGYGGTGGGGSLTAPDSSNEASKTSPGTGDRVSKYPFGDTSYFKPHCAGGGGGATWYDGEYGSEQYSGGAGGTNGSDGSYATSSNLQIVPGGAGGNYGGGTGGAVQDYNGAQAENGGNATFYGSGGGGGGYINFNDGEDEAYGLGGSGYQGVIYVRIPVDQ